MSAEKSALRLEMAKRRALAHSTIDPTPAVNALIAALHDTKGPISFYWPIRSEIDPRAAMRALAATHDVCLPVSDGYRPLTFRAWSEGQPLQTDGFGVKTPDASAPEVAPKTLVVPLLAFDARGHRLGYGAGHYDRTIAEFKKAGPVRTVGFAYAAQKHHVPLPIDPTDQPLDLIITESGTLTPLSFSW